MNNTSVDSYLHDGCGRCHHYQTPACKVHRWAQPLRSVRELLASTCLTEEMKWGHPCYTLNGKNVLMLSALSDYCAISFLKGAALTCESGLLESPGPNSRFARVVKFRSSEEFDDKRSIVQGLIEQAIAAEKAGIKVELPAAADPLPAELEERLDSHPQLHDAFYALTPGRRRSHIIHISGAKQPQTRERRVDACIPRILKGRGFNERE